MFVSPTAVRALKKFGTDPMQKNDLSKLEMVIVAGEPLDEATDMVILISHV